VLFFRHRRKAAFDGDDLLLAQEIAARASVCVDNARRYTRERATALALQRSLLPRLTQQHAAVDVASRYLPANAGVGGDWFDVIPLSGARVALVVGDVVGHGIPAAATMGRMSTAVRTLADMELPPEELLTHLDDLVITLNRENGGENSPVSGEIGSTCLYAIYDPLTAICTMARAGHPPPALAAADGLVEFPDLPSGPPLGVGGLPFESVRVPVPDGSLLAFYTNGVIGAANGDLDVGLGVLRDTLHRHTGSLEQTCDSIVASLLQDRPQDDLALLLARTRTLDASQVATWDLSKDPAAVAQARRQAGRRLADWGLTDLAFTTELIVSELVTNAIRYGTEPLQLRLIREASLTCEVADRSSAVPRVQRARTLDEGGRGLLVVAQLSDRWGSRHTDDGKVIWTEQFLQDR
jgi:serine phosphatase RsbU (regulator of sigma subunit)/anti-sigma regulatory factor (Ser/Thr protein kinase)